MSKLDRIEELTQEEKSRLFASFVYVSSGIGMWAFNLEGKLHYSTSQLEKEYFDFFKIGGCYDFMLNNIDKMNKPLMLSDDMGLVWVAEAMFDEYKHVKVVILMGPLFLSKVTLKKLEERLSRKNFSVELMRQMIRAIEGVPVIYRNVLSVYISMMHFAITNNPWDDDIFYQNDGFLNDDILNGCEESGHYNSEAEIRGERIFLSAIREGNLRYMQIFDEEIMSDGRLLTDTGDSLRDAKNTVLVFNSLCARAAMDGGLAVSICRKLEHEFANGIEDCKTISMLSDFNENLIYTYVSRVHAHNSNKGKSKAVEEFCEYIRANVYGDISIDDIAQELGYSTYYFTKKFTREMGMKVADYIRQTRIEYARLELVSTNKSVEEISERLHFGTRNYFSRVFKEATGMSPGEYRKRGKI